MIEKSNHCYPKLYLSLSKIPYEKISTYGNISDLIYAFVKARKVR